jgi:hypothetical protein
VKSLGCQYRTTARASATGSGVPILTRTTTAATTATGAAECIAMHSEQWSASLSSGCECATWTKAIIASRTRHRKAAAPKAHGSRRPLPLKSGWFPVKNPLQLQGYTKLDAAGSVRVPNSHRISSESLINQSIRVPDIDPQLRGRIRPDCARRYYIRR